MDETWSIRAIARHYDVDPTTARYWTEQEWFPAPLVPASGRGYPAHYDPAQVKRAVRNWRQRRARKGDGRGRPRGRSTP